MYVLEYWFKNFLFRQLVNSMQNQVQSTKWHLAITRLNQPVGYPWSISGFKLHFLFWVGILNILPQIYNSQPLLKDSLSL